jgi:hypothetical protein
LEVGVLWWIHIPWQEVVGVFVRFMRRFGYDGRFNNKLVLNNKEIYVNTAGIVCAKDDKPKTRSEKNDWED